MITHGAVHTDSFSDNLKFQEKLDEYGNHEIFFAQKIILCEGKDDLFAIRSYLDKLDYDYESASLSILSCGGIKNIPDFANIANKLKIPFCVVTDMDMEQTGTVKPNTQSARDSVQEIKSTNDLMVEWDNTLEDCLNTPFKQDGQERQKAKPEWQRSTIFVKEMKDIIKEFPNFKNTCEAITSWLN